MPRYRIWVDYPVWAISDRGQISFGLGGEIFRVREPSGEDWAAARQRPPSEDGSCRSPQTCLKNGKINFYAKEEV